MLFLILFLPRGITNGYVIFSLTSTFSAMAADSLMAQATAPEERGRAGGWSQAGNLGGSDWAVVSPYGSRSTSMRYGSPASCSASSAFCRLWP